MKPLAQMTNQELVDHIDALFQTRLDILREKLRFDHQQEMRAALLRRYDPDQLDHDEESDGDWTR